MSRKPRYVLPSVPQQVVQRGHNREPCFFRGSRLSALPAQISPSCTEKPRSDSRPYLDDQSPTFVAHARSHLRFDPYDAGYRPNVRPLHQLGVARHGRSLGGAIQGQSDRQRGLFAHLYALYRNEPGEHRWSSFAVNAQRRPDTLPGWWPLYESLGKTRQQREYAYRELFRWDPDSGDVHQIREPLNQELVLGREDFKDTIEQMLNRQGRPGISGQAKIENQSALYSVLQ